MKSIRITRTTALVMAAGRAVVLAVAPPLVLVALAGVLMTTVMQSSIRAQEGKDSTGKLTVPWEEFKKLVNLDEDQVVVSLDAYQKLLAQTGIETTPHTLKDGNVVLTRAEFKRLIDLMKPPATPGATPPFDYLITKATYSGKMQSDNTTFTANFNVHVLKKNAYLNVPILPQRVALADMKIGGRPALVVTQNGYHSVVLPEAGEYDVTASFSIRSSLDKGPHKLDLTILRTPITLLRLELPLRDIDVEIPQAQQVLTSQVGNKTVVSAVITQGTALSVRWRKAAAVTDKIPAKVYAEVHHLVSVEDDALKTSSDINYNILHSEVDAVQIVIPDNMNVLTVTGEGVGEWQVTGQNDRNVLLVPFTYGKKGAVTVRVTSETAYSETGQANQFRGLQTLDTVRETGFIGIELATSAEVIVSDHDGLEEVVVQKLPVRLVNKSARPLVMGFKYLKHPYNLVFDIKKHDKVAVPIATINSANVVTLFTEDGKIVHRLVYQIRNAAKQFLEIQLPDNVDVWSVFVGQRPVESSVNGQGKLLVPLIRSRAADNQLKTFPVEIIYCAVDDGFSPFGSQQSSLPAVDLLISQLIWSVYLPNDYSYVYFKSTLEKEDIIRGVNILTRNRRLYDKDAMMRVGSVGDEADNEEMKRAYKGEGYRSSFKNVPVKEDQLSSQVSAELEFGGRLDLLARGNMAQAPMSGGAVTTGVLPVQIQVPTGGQVYRFARTIIRTEDPLTFSVVYSRMWFVTLVQWIIAALALWIVYLNRRRLRRLLARLGEMLTTITGTLKKYESATRRYARSTMTPFVLFGLAVASWFVWGFLTVVFLLLSWMSLVYQIMRHMKNRAQAKKQAAEPDPAG